MKDKKYIWSDRVEKSINDALEMIGEALIDHIAHEQQEIVFQDYEERIMHALQERGIDLEQKYTLFDGFVSLNPNTKLVRSMVLGEEAILLVVLSDDSGKLHLYSFMALMDYEL